MLCNEHLTSPYLCGCKKNDGSTYPTSSRARTSTSRPQSLCVPICACKYDPFTDEAKDTEIHDLEYVVHKVKVMKCQMKKWRVERLQLESELRSMKKKLQSLGVDVQNVTAEDPLIKHYREENERLESMIEQLEKEIKDMEMTINDPVLYENPSQGIEKIRDKIHTLHEQSKRDIKKLEEKKKELLRELADTTGVSPCAGVNRLRAKVRELMNQLAEKKDAQGKHQPDASDEISIEFTALAKNYEDLRTENEGLRMENQNLRQALGTTEDSIDSRGIGKPSGTNVVEIGVQSGIPSSISQHSEGNIGMKTKLREYHATIGHLKREIIEKDDIIQAQQRKMEYEMEKMRVSHEKLMTQACSDKIQLQKCEEKVGRLLSQLGQSSSSALEPVQSGGQVDRAHPRFDELLMERNRLEDHMTEIRRESADKDDEIRRILAENDNILRDSVAKSKELQAKIDDLVRQDRLARREIDESNEGIQIISSRGKQTNEIEKKSESKAQLELTTLKRELDQLTIKLDNAERDNNDLRTERDAFKHEIVKKDEMQLENEAMRKKIVDMAKHIEVQKQEFSIDSREIENLNRELENARRELETSQSRITELTEELSECQIDNDEWDTLDKALVDEQHAKNAALSKIATLNHELHGLRDELKKCRDQNEELQNYQTTKTEVEALKIDNATLKNEVDDLRSENSKIQKDLKNLEDINKNLSLELNTLRKALSDSEAQVGKLDSSFNALTSEKESLLTALSSMQEGMEALKRSIHTKDIELEDAVALKQELIALKNEFRKSREELERCKHDLNSSKEHIGTLRSDRKILRRGSMKFDENIDQAEVHRDHEKESGAVTDNTIREEMKALKNTLGKLTRDLEKCNMENGRLHTQLDKWKNDAEILKAELEGMKDENMKVVGELKAVKNKLGHLNREMDEMNLQNSRLERDLMRMRQEMESTIADRNKLEVENAAMKKNIDKLLREPRNYVGDVSELADEIERLKMENEELKTEIESVEKGLTSTSLSGGKIVDGEHTVKTTASSERKRRHFEKSSDFMEDMKKENIKIKGGSDKDGAESVRSRRSVKFPKTSQVSGERSITQLDADPSDILNDLIRALDVIRLEMEKQKKAITRIRENIANMDKQKWPDSSNYTDFDDPIVLNTTNPIAAEVFQLLGSLSTNISYAEQELINFCEVWKARWEDKARLEKLVRDSKDVGTSETPGLSFGRTAKDAGSFDPESWLDSLTLTQLAELHDKICLLTSNMVVQDVSPSRGESRDAASSSSRNQNSLQHNYDVLNNRIGALQREIQEKQMEAGKKVFEMRQLLRREQAELLRISEAMSREKKRNLIMQFTIDEPPCRVFDCNAKCAKSLKLIHRSVCGKCNNII